jgi:hypothetical protein
MDNDTLDYLARRLGRVYDESLKGGKWCDSATCSMRKADGTCDCTDHIKDVIDMVWEAKAGRPERLDAFFEELMDEAGKKEN